MTIKTKDERPHTLETQKLANLSAPVARKRPIMHKGIGAIDQSFQTFDWDELI